MTKQQFKFFAFLSVFIICSYFANGYDERLNTTQNFKQLFAEYKKNDVLDNRYNDFLARLFSEGLDCMNMNLKIRINDEYDVDALNIYVVDIVGFLNNQSGVAVKRKVNRVAMRNFTVMPPNVVIVDRDFLVTMLIECYNNEVFWVEYLSTLNEKDKIKYEEVKPYLARAMFLRLNNLYNLINNKNEKMYNESTYDKAGELSKVFIKVQNEVDISFVFFMPIITHELSHIKNGYMGNYYNTGEMITSFFTRYSEESADEDASKAVRVYLNKNERNNGFYEMQLMSFSEFMRDIVLLEMYQGFRNMDSRFFLTTIEQKDYNSIIKMGEYEQIIQKPFYHKDRVLNAWSTTIPIMTEEELTNVTKIMDEKGSSQSHRHIFLRCRELIENIKKDNIKTPWSDVFEKFYIDEMEQVFGLINPNKRVNLFTVADMKRMDVRLSDIISEKGMERIEFHEALNFEKNHCRIGHFKNKDGITDGYIEVYEDAGYLTKIKLVISTRELGNIDMPNINNIAMFSSIVNRLIPQAGSEFIGAMYFKLRQPGWLNTIEKVINGKMIKCYPYNQSMYLCLEVSATDKADDENIMDGLEPYYKQFNETYDQIKKGR